MIIQSPEMFAHKDRVAKENIGRHLLVGLSCKNGIIFARLANTRSSSSAQGKSEAPKWISAFDNRIITASIGDLGGVSEILSNTSAAQDDLAEIITDRYVTAKATERMVRKLMRFRYEQEPFAYGAHALVASLDNPHEFSFVDFRGKTKRFYNFVVAGGELDSPETKVVKKNAIDYLARRCAGDQNQKWRLTGMALRVMKKVFADFDPSETDSRVEYILVRKGSISCIRN